MKTVAEGNQEFELIVSDSFAETLKNGYKRTSHYKMTSPLLGNGKHSYHPIYNLYVLLKNEKSANEELFADYEKASVKYYKDQFPEGVKDDYENYVPLIENPRRALWKEYFLGAEENFNKKLLEALNENKE